MRQVAIQILRALSASTRMVAVDTAMDKLEIAKRMGADEGLVSADKALKRINDRTRGHGAELVLDLVGINPTLSDGSSNCSCARPFDDRGSQRRNPAGELVQSTA